jgi:hypothetical protein
VHRAGGAAHRDRLHLPAGLEVLGPVVQQPVGQLALEGQPEAA